VEIAPSGERSYRLLSGKELTDLVARRGQIYAAYPPDERPRLSLAGAQDKCPVLYRDGAFFLPQKEAPSSHILKFELADYRHVPVYETFTTILAQHIGLPVVEIDLCEIHEQRCALIERYDRKLDDKGDVQRLHQEDFCQALGFGHDRKYQQTGGPSFADCNRLVRDESTEPAIDTQDLLRWQIFNVLAGNSDGHAKNLTFIYLASDEIRLAPFYDLVCTRAIERIDYHLAFDVGGERDPGNIRKAHWDALADQCDVRSGFLFSLVEETADRLLNHLPDAKESFESRFGAYPALQRVERIVKKQCRRATG
jgi:serine/threonine-protein kinase HipA